MGEIEEIYESPLTKMHLSGSYHISDREQDRNQEIG